MCVCVCVFFLAAYVAVAVDVAAHFINIFSYYESPESMLSRSLASLSLQLLPLRRVATEFHALSSYLIANKLCSSWPASQSVCVANGR